MPNNKESTYYTGNQREAWKTAIRDLNLLQEKVLPKILEKDQDDKWTKVEENFPVIDSFQFQELDGGYNAIQFCANEARNIDSPRSHKASRMEESALNLLFLLRKKKFMEIFKARKKTWDLWTSMTERYNELPSKEYNESLRLEHRNAEPNNKQIIKTIIEQRFRAYKQLRANFDQALELFKQSSERTARTEGKPFDEQFNKNKYVNYFIFVKEGFHDSAVHFNSYLKQQDESWKRVIAYLMEARHELSTTARDSCCPRETVRQTRINFETKRFRNMLELFVTSINEASNTLKDSDLAVIKGSRKRLEKLLQTLETLHINSDIDASKEDIHYVNNAHKLLYPIYKKEEALKEKQMKELMKKQTQIYQENISSIINHYRHFDFL